MFFLGRNFFQEVSPKPSSRTFQTIFTSQVKQSRSHIPRLAAISPHADLGENARGFAPHPRTREYIFRALLLFLLNIGGSARPRRVLVVALSERDERTRRKGPSAPHGHKCTSSCETSKPRVAADRNPTTPLVWANRAYNSDVSAGLPVSLWRVFKEMNQRN